MKKIYLLFFMSIVLSCSSPTRERSSVDKAPAVKGIAEDKVKEEKKDEPALYSLMPATKADFDKAAANHTVSFTMNKGDARKVNGVITLKINGEWKPVKGLKDTLLNTDDTEMAEFRYLGQNKGLNKYLVAGYFYESYETYLVDKATGQIDATTWTEPSASPDLSFLANLSIATLMDSSPNGIQVWKVIDNGERTALKKYFEINQQTWEAFEMQWESPRAIIIKVIPIKHFEMLEGEPKQDDFSYLRLNIK